MLICLSIDHHRVDLGTLEHIERHSDQLVSTLSSTEMAAGAVVLVTCNRFEAYFDAHPESDVPSLALERIAAITSLSESQLSRAMTIHSGDDAAEHLFAVSGGLESALVGEGEIVGQVRRALERARAEGRVTSELERLFQIATRTSRQIKNRTGLQTAGRSLVRLALTMAESRIGDWASTRVLLIGTGTYAGASLAALRARGAQNIGVFSPSGRAEKFANSHAIEPVAADALDARLSDSDLVLACTSTTEPLLTSEQFARTATAGRPPFCSVATTARVYPRPRLLIDMGLPRNIDPSAASVPGVELLDLETVALHAPIPELSAEAEARKIVREAAEEFVSARAENDAVPQLLALRNHVATLLDEELARLSRHGRVDPAVESALRHFTGRLLHQPTVKLRELARNGRALDAARAVELLTGADLASHELSSAS